MIFRMESRLSSFLLLLLFSFLRLYSCPLLAFLNTARHQHHVFLASWASQSASQNMTGHTVCLSVCRLVPRCTHKKNQKLFRSFIIIKPQRRKEDTICSFMNYDTYVRTCVRASAAEIIHIGAEKTQNQTKPASEHMHVSITDPSTTCT